jgi:hypothetical protein
MNHISNDQLNLYIDNEISHEIKTKFDAHIAICSECRVKMQELAAVHLNLKKLNQYEVSEQFNLKVMEKIVSTIKKSVRKGMPGFVIFLMTMFSLISASIIFIVIYQMTNFQNIKLGGENISNLIMEYSKSISTEIQTFAAPGKVDILFLVLLTMLIISGFLLYDKVKSIKT